MLNNSAYSCYAEATCVCYAENTCVCYVEATCVCYADNTWACYAEATCVCYAEATCVCYAENSCVCYAENTWTCNAEGTQAGYAELAYTNPKKSWNNSSCNYTQRFNNSLDLSSYPLQKFKKHSSHAINPSNHGINQLIALCD